jgi:hypothetical protein
MDVFQDAAKLIANLEKVGESYLKSPENTAEFATSGVGYLGQVSALIGGATGSFHGLEVRLRGPEVQKGLEHYGQTAKDIEAETTQGLLILWASFLVDVLEFTTGFGAPHQGDDLTAGSEQFNKVYEQLGSAFPDDGWQGAASQGYAKQNKDLQDLAKKMQELDAKLAAIAKDHADWVTHIRLGLAILKDLLLAAFVIFWIIMATVPPPGNLTAANTFDKIVACIGAGLAIGMIGTLAGLSAKHGQDAGAVTLEYGGVAESASKLSVGLPAAEPQVPAAEQSTVSSFEGPKAMAAAPDLATLVSTAQADAALPPQQQAFMDALTEDGAAAPALKLPSLKDIGQAAGQVSQMSGQVSQMMNQFMGQIQQLASMAPQGKGPEPAKAAEKVAEKEAAPKEGATPAAGERAPAEPVAAGAGGAERAPVDVTTGGGEPAQRPNPVERSEPRP